MNFEPNSRLEEGSAQADSRASRTLLGGQATDFGELRNIQFHQLVSLLELQPGRRNRVGGVEDPSGEAIRFRATRSLSFGPGDISSVAFDERFGWLEIRVNFFGLYGPASPLPPFYTERIIEEDAVPSAVEDLFDLFNHRLISLLHTVWRKHRYYLRYEDAGSDGLSRRFLALCGFPLDERNHIGGISRSSLLPYIGLISLYTSSAEVVAATISSFFDVECRVEQFVERRVRMDDSALFRLGVANNMLAEDAVIGSEIDDSLGKFRLHLHADSFSELARFLPHGDQYRPLVELMTMASREPLEWDIGYDFDAGSIDLARLGDCRLGWSSWLHADLPENLESRVCITPPETACGELAA